MEDNRIDETYLNLKVPKQGSAIRFPARAATENRSTGLSGKRARLNCLVD